MQMGMFFFLPNILLSGYMFPFRGMPGWAQDIGQCLPLTHFLRIVRGILLKGNGAGGNRAGLVAIALFLVVMLAIGIKALPADAGLTCRPGLRLGFQTPDEVCYQLICRTTNVKLNGWFVITL